MQLLNLRYTARLLARSPAFTVSAILCLGLGIGVTSSLFSIFNTLLWKPLPVADPGALVRVFAQGPVRTRVYRNFSYPEYLDYRRENRALAGLVATTGIQAVLRQSGDEAARIFGEAVSADYFQMLGLRRDASGYEVRQETLSRMVPPPLPAGTRHENPESTSRARPRPLRSPRYDAAAPTGRCGHWPR